MNIHSHNEMLNIIKVIDELNLNDWFIQSSKLNMKNENTLKIFNHKLIQDDNHTTISFMSALRSAKFFFRL